MRVLFLEVYGTCEIEDGVMNDKNAVTATGNDKFTRLVFNGKSGVLVLESRELRNS